MEWTQSDTLALAAAKCTYCSGTGLLRTRKGTKIPCKCVFRSIFHACYAKFRECATKEKSLSVARLEYSPRGGRMTWGRKNEEFVADFILTTRRTLSPDEWKIFSWHYLLGADYRLICRRLKVDRGVYFHNVYRIQQKLGKMFRELQPYSLFPLDQYFHGCTPNDSSWSQANATPLRRNSLNRVLDMPIRRAA